MMINMQHSLHSIHEHAIYAMQPPTRSILDVRTRRCRPRDRKSFPWMAAHGGSDIWMLSSIAAALPVRLLALLAAVDRSLHSTDKPRSRRDR